MKKEKFGFLRETTESALKAGIDKSTGLHRTGLNEYLAIIFPSVKDWIYDKPIGKLPDGSNCRKRPDYRSEKLKLIIEFDGIQHYQSPEQIIKDAENTKLYMSLGYTVVRIPYFIQLTNEAVEILFNKKVKRKLFNVKYPSLDETCGPAVLCPAGIQRMAHEFLLFPEQLDVNLDRLRSIDNDYITGLSLLEKEIDAILYDHQVDYNYLFTSIFGEELNQIYEDAYGNYICGREEIKNGLPIESIFPSHKDFYETFYMNKINSEKIEDKFIDLLHTVFLEKTEYCLIHDKDYPFLESEEVE